MTYSNERLNDIYDRTSGYCHICHKKLAFKNHAALGKRGAWEVEHSNPRAKGGTDKLQNLFAACISCNRSKGKGTTKAARAANGKTKAPLHVAKRRQEKMKNAAAGAVVGAGVGAVFGPLGALVFGALGAKIGHDQNPDHQYAWTS
jgi:hypothetical protein